MPPAYRVVFGYRTVVGVPTCPCKNPGDYLAMEQSTTDLLEIRFICWCGRTVKGRMESIKELSDFLAKNGVSEETTK